MISIQSYYIIFLEKTQDFSDFFADLRREKKKNLSQIL